MKTGLVALALVILCVSVAAAFFVGMRGLNRTGETTPGQPVFPQAAKEAPGKNKALPRPEEDLAALKAQKKANEEELAALKAQKVAEEAARLKAAEEKAAKAEAEAARLKAEAAEAEAARRKGNGNKPVDPPPKPENKETDKLVGSWEAIVFELGILTEIIWHIRPDGTTGYVFTQAAGASTCNGTWTFSDGVIYEKTVGGIPSSAAIQWIDRNTFKVTIKDNGNPRLRGATRTYRRL